MTGDPLWQRVADLEKRLDALTKPLTIYDISTDERRPATQEDVYRLEKSENRLSQLWSLCQRWEAEDKANAHKP